MTTEKEMQKLFYKHRYANYELIATNVCLNSGSNEMDILALRSNGLMDEIEIKSTLQSYKDDFSKTIRFKREETDNGYPLYDEIPKHYAIKNGLTACNYFWFLMPDELVDKCDIPGYAGILIYSADDNGVNRLRLRKSPKLLHEHKLSDKERYNAAKRMATEYWRYAGKID